MRSTFTGILVAVSLFIHGLVFAGPGPGAGTGEDAPRVDLYGDALPVGAIARLGTVRFLTNDGASGLTFVGGDKQLVAGSGRGVRFWKADSGQELKHFGLLNRVMCAAVSPDQTTIAVGENGPRIFVFDVATGKERLQVTGDKDRPSCVAWSADGRWLAAGFGKTIYLWDATTGKLAHRLPSDDEYVYAVAINPNGKSLIAGGRKIAQIWELSSGKKLADLEGHFESGSGSLAFTADGSMLIGSCNEPTGPGSSRSSLRQWDAATGKKVRDLAGGDFNGIAFAPDGKTLAGTNGSYIHIWDFATGKELRKWLAHVYHAGALAFNRDGTLLASTGMDRRICLWDPATGKELRPNPGHSGPVNALACAPDGRVVASGGPDSTMRCWDVVTGRELRRRDDLGPRMLGFFWGVIDLAYSPDGKTLVSAERHTSKTTFRVWEADSFKSLSQYDGEHISAIHCGLDNETLLSATWDGNIAVRELTRGKLLSRASKHVTHLHSISQSPDGRMVAWVGQYGGWGVVDLKSGKDVFRSAKDVSGAVRIAFAPDGAVLATGGNGGSPVRLWEAATGRLLTEWKGMRSTEVAFSPDGRLLAATEGQAIALWDVAARAEVLRWTCDHGHAIRLVFALNGQAVVSAHDDGTLLVWDVTGQLKEGKLPRRPLKDAEIVAHWKALEGADVAAAHRAIWALAAAAPQSLAAAEKRLHPVPATVDIGRMIADLDSEAFEVRDKASRELGELGDAAEEALRRVLTGNSSIELRRRAAMLLKALDEPAVHARRLQERRTIAVLEYAGDKEARQILDRLASGAREASLTAAARAALDRVTRRP